jgi:hypothetical protein
MLENDICAAWAKDMELYHSIATNDVNMKIKKILSYLNEKISDAKEEINEAKTQGCSNSYGIGYEAGILSTLQDLKQFIKELTETKRG